MNCSVRAVILSVAVAALIGSATVASAGERPDTSGPDRAGRYAFDLLVLRTAGVAKIAFGSLFLIPAYPLSIGSGASDEVVSRLVVEPARDTFQRPIGDL